MLPPPVMIALTSEKKLVGCYHTYTQLLRFTDGEHFTEIKENLDNQIRPGLQIESISTDGHKSILRAIEKSLPNVAVQRCIGSFAAVIYFLFVDQRKSLHSQT